MARAYNIWIVTRVGVPVAAFTVRRELADWMTRLAEPEQYLIYRMKDGGDWGHKLYTYKDFQ